MVDEDRKRPHAIFFPYPLQGHVIPAVHFATKLASAGFTITFVNTHFVHHQISKSGADGRGGDDIFTASRKAGLDIRYETISDGFPLGFDRSLNHDQFWEGALHVLPAHVEEFVERKVSSKEKVSVLIADTFFVWPSTVAKKYNLLYVSFWTEPALVLTIYYHLHLLRSHGHFGSQDNRTDTIDYIPGVRAVEPTDLMSYLQPSCKDTSSICHRIIDKAFDDVKRADFIIINTVRELEEETISALHQTQPTYAIGPIFPTGFIDSPVATSMWPESNCTQWLDSKPPGSVLYVSFGSYAHASKPAIHEIARGLLQSGVNFIWVVRPDIVSSDDPDPLPVGFEQKAREEGRGLVVVWCSQNKVLSHCAVGGFLTHCGWNSILESIWCGVPLLCFPLYTDQFTNRKLTVDDWKVGINLCDGDWVIRGEEVSKKIDRLMRGETAEDLRVKIKKVKKVLEDAWAAGGSSETGFRQFVEDIEVKINQKSK
ncbi:hypothetical protein Nepgr_030604 [Nepenthes gracilis]|uniref:Glycosyltransferase n=1 Tax=Nepenthes gracilis TaxID=150966 RepID=A0AAD3TGZ1_NEPGR|nr:hypothetical protein Nepgr_030604 [Nepenthes gracilis]